jgi:hypothetical protein
MNKLKMTICALAIPAGMLMCVTSASADNNPLDWLGCCLDPNPIECLFGSNITSEHEEGKALIERIQKLSDEGGFKESQASKAELGLARGPYTTTCSADEVVSLFEKRLSLKEIQAHCEIKSTSK